MAYWLQALALVAWAALAGQVQAQAAQRPLCPDDKLQCLAREGNGKDEYPYRIDGVQLLLEFTDGGYFKFECSGNLTLDNAALPRFASTQRYKNIYIVSCPPPRGSYADVFDYLNVRALDKLKLVEAGNLTGAHLANLSDVLALELYKAELAPHALDALPGLRRLGLDSVRLPPGALLRLPRALQALQLTRMGADVTPAVLRELPHLVNVTVRDSRALSVALTEQLEALALEMPAVRVPSALPPALRVLTLNGWAERRPAPWSSCALEALDVLVVMAEELPAYWVGKCAELHVLRVQHAPQLRTLHETSLRGAQKLQKLTFSSTALTELPPGLLEDAKDLTLLDLSGNHLESLPAGLFVRTKHLQELNLSRNRLTTSVYWSLSAVTSLTVLDLSFNVLKDSCGGSNDTVLGSSPLQELKKLTKLCLKRTNTSVICRDWRETMPLLTELNLAENNFVSVTYTDLLFRGAGRLELKLSGNAISTLQYERSDYELAVGGADVSRADVTLGGALTCDCGVYWAARALRERPAHVALRPACASGRALGAVPLDELRCAAPRRAPRRAPPRARAAPGVRARRPRARAGRAAPGGGGAAARRRGARRLRVAAVPRAQPHRRPRRRRLPQISIGSEPDEQLAVVAERARRARAAGGRAARQPGAQPAALRLRRRRHAGRAAGAPGRAGGLRAPHVRRRRAPGRRARAALRRAAGRRRRGRAGCAGGATGRGRAGGPAVPPRAAPAPQGGAACARLAAGGARAGRRAPLRRVRVLLARRRALRARRAGGAAGERADAVPPVRALPRLGAGRLDPGADRRVRARVAPHRGRGVGALPALGVGARRVPGGLCARVARRAPAPGRGAAGRAGRAAAGRQAAPLPRHQHLCPLGRPLVLAEAAPGVAARSRSRAGRARSGGGRTRTGDGRARSGGGRARTGDGRVRTDESRTRAERGGGGVLGAVGGVVAERFGELVEFAELIAVVLELCGVRAGAGAAGARVVRARAAPDQRVCLMQCHSSACIF